MRNLVFACLFLSLATTRVAANEPLRRIVRPDDGKLYHGVFPGSEIRDSEEQVTEHDWESYVRQVGMGVTWVYFSHEWSCSTEFPWQTVGWIGYEDENKHTMVPFVRLMLRSSTKQSAAANDRYKLDAIVNGEFDDQIRRWGEEAAAYAKPLIVEYGTECNVKSFPWNGKYNGAGSKTGFGLPENYDGPERFVHAFRRIVHLMRTAGAENITWVFHVNWSSDPREEWNKLKYYYPDDFERYPRWEGEDERDSVDWFAVSCYGALEPQQTWHPDTFEVAMNDVHRQLLELDSDKPIVVAEFGTTSGYFEQHPQGCGREDFKPDAWAKNALDSLFTDNWKNVIGFSWWNEYWINDADPANDSNMRLESIYELSHVFRQMLEGHSDDIQVQANTREVD